MLASKVIALAKATELKQLAIKGDDEAIVGFINLGVLALYKRFDLKVEEAIITTKNGKTVYTLDSTDADVSMGSTNDFLIVTECFDEGGDPVSLNNEFDPLGIMTPSWNTVEISMYSAGERFSIMYRSAPAFITKTTDPIPVPPQLLEALLHFIGYRGHGTITSEVKQENNTHYIRFDASCKEVEESGLVLVDDLISQKFEDRGFV